jgi:hypothetical protein
MGGQHAERSSGSKSGYTPSNVFLFSASTIAGMLGDVSVHPADTIKTWQQGHRGSVPMGALSAVKDIYARSGLRGYYRGYNAVITLGIPCNTMYFGAYAVSLKKIEQHFPQWHQTWQSYVVAGSIAEVATGLWSVPESILKRQKQMSQGRVQVGLVQSMKSLYSNGGIGAFYTGFVPQMLAQVPLTAVYFAGYEFFKSKLVQRKETRTTDASSSSSSSSGTPSNALPFWQYFLCSSLSAGVGAYISNPMDVVTMRLQTQDATHQFFGEAVEAASSESLALPKVHQQQGSTRGVRYTSVKHTIKSIFEEEGIKGFQKGFWVRTLYIAPWLAISHTAFEKLCDWHKAKHAHEYPVPVETRS